MAKMLCRTKGTANPKGKPRVYFTCHPEDFNRYFNKICVDIFTTHDCAIFYTEDMNAVIEEQDKATDLESNNLFIVPVTFRLLSHPNRAMGSDIPFAKEKHIPILPLMMEPGLDNLYAEKFDELQYLNPYSTDLTEISYEEKLKKYLESVLISDEMAKRIRAAFDAYIFLSYRKKDRRYANELMRLIHTRPECRDVAIWYDEFLTPGESFRGNIEKILSSSKLFALLVTPNLLEEPGGKPNFVMGEEYPTAYRSGIDILPVEMEETDKEALAEKYQDIPLCVDPHDEAFTARLLESISKIATTADKDDPMHNFLIGLAYTEGIDVEVDRDKGMQLIIDAADSGCLEAMRKLVDIYEVANPKNKDKMIEWLSKAVLAAENLFRSTPDYQLFQSLVADISRLFNLQMHYRVQTAKDMFIHIVAFDSFLREENLFQDSSEIQALRAAYTNLFRHRAKKHKLRTVSENEPRDFEEWLTAYEQFCANTPDSPKGELALAYEHYAWVLDEEKAFGASVAIAKKLLQLALEETAKSQVQLTEDYSSRFFADVPDDVHRYSFWLITSLAGYLLVARGYSDNQRQCLKHIKKFLELAEDLRGHAISHSTCGDIAMCYKLLSNKFEEAGQTFLAQKANEYVHVIHAGMHEGKKIIPKYDKEIHASLQELTALPD